MNRWQTYKSQRDSVGYRTLSNHPVVLLSKGMALARDRQQESKRAIKTVRRKTWPGRREGGRRKERFVKNRTELAVMPSRLYSGIIKDPRYRRSLSLESVS